MGALKVGLRFAFEARFEFVAEAANSRGFLRVDGICGSSRQGFKAIQLAAGAFDIGKHFVHRHALKVGLEDAQGWVIAFRCHGILRATNGTRMIDDAGGMARALGPCLPARQTPQSGPKHRLGEMSTSLWILKGSLTSTGLSLINEFVK